MLQISSLPQNHPHWRRKARWQYRPLLWIKYHKTIEPEESHMRQKRVVCTGPVDGGGRDDNHNNGHNAYIQCAGTRGQSLQKVEETLTKTSHGDEEGAVFFSSACGDSQRMVRIGLIVRKKIYLLAVARHRVKRRLRHAIRDSMHKNPQAWEGISTCVVMALSVDLAKVSFDDIVRQVSPG